MVTLPWALEKFAAGESPEQDSSAAIARRSLKDLGQALLGECGELVADTHADT